MMSCDAKQVNVPLAVLKVSEPLLPTSHLPDRETLLPPDTSRCVCVRFHLGALRGPVGAELVLPPRWQVRPQKSDFIRIIAAS